MREFSILRLGYLVRNRLLADLTPIALGAGVLLGLQVLIQLLSLLGNQSFHTRGTEDAGGVWIGLTVLACLLTSSRGFRDMQSAKSATDWLLLPATLSEKYLSVLLVTQIVVPVVATCLGLLLWVVSGPVQLPPSLGQWQLWGSFVVTNLLFLTGSTVYRKLAGLKTFGTLIGFALAVALVILIGLRLFGTTGSGGLGFGPNFHGNWHFGDHEISSWLSTALDWLWSLGAYLVTPVAAIAFGFYRVKEKEARDAVQ